MFFPPCPNAALFPLRLPALPAGTASSTLGDRGVLQPQGGREATAALAPGGVAGSGTAQCWARSCPTAPARLRTSPQAPSPCFQPCTSALAPAAPKAEDTGDCSWPWVSCQNLGQDGGRCRKTFQLPLPLPSFFLSLLSFRSTHLHAHSSYYNIPHNHIGASHSSVPHIKN